MHTYQRPDAGDVTFDPTRRSLSGNSGSLAFNKITGRLLHFTSNIGYKSPGFDINDLGFETRADEINASNWFQLIHDRLGKHVQAFRINFNQYAGWNFDGDLRYNGGNVNAHWVLNNNWSFGTGFNANGRGFDDRLTRGGPGGFGNSSLSQWGYINSDERKAVMGYLNLSWYNDRHGSHEWNLGPGVTWRPQPALAISLGLNLDRNLADTQWVENVADGGRTHYVFGRLDQTTVGISTRVNYTITPNLTVQIYAQPFVSAGAYDHFKELVNGRASAYASRYAAFAYGSDPDFNYHSFRTTNVLRWEFRPGSALFVVWQQGREDTTSNGDFSLGRDLHATLNTPATNVFLIKISRWMNF